MEDWFHVVVVRRDTETGAVVSKPHGAGLSFDTREGADEVAAELRESLQGSDWKVCVVSGGGDRRP